jgi:hypothetical protein
MAHVHNTEHPIVTCPYPTHPTPLPATKKGCNAPASPKSSVHARMHARTTLRTPPLLLAQRWKTRGGHNGHTFSPYPPPPQPKRPNHMSHAQTPANTLGTLPHPRGANNYIGWGTSYQPQGAAVSPRVAPTHAAAPVTSRAAVDRRSVPLLVTGDVCSVAPTDTQAPHMYGGALRTYTRN